MINLNDLSIVVELVPSNQNLAIFHVRRPLTKLGRESGYYGVIDPSSQGSPVLPLICGVNGVEYAELSAFAVRVFKGTLFSWDAVAPPVINILQDYDMAQELMEGGGRAAQFKNVEEMCVPQETDMTPALPSAPGQIPPFAPSPEPDRREEREWTNETWNEL